MSKLFTAFWRVVSKRDRRLLPSHSGLRSAIALLGVMLSFLGPPPVMGQPSNPYLFQGTRYDEETGFYYFRNRYYAPQEGRFLQRDPVWDDRNVGNAYTLVANGPTTRMDPLGLDDPRLHYANDLEIAKLKALSGNPRAVARVHRLQDLLKGEPLNSSPPPADPVNVALQLARKGIVQYQFRGATEVTEGYSRKPIAPGKIGLNCEQFLQKAWRDADLSPAPIPVSSITGRWPGPLRRAYSKKFEEEFALSEAGYFGAFGGHFKPAPDDYAPQRNDVIVYFLPNQAKHIAMFTGRGNEVVENTSISNASLYENAFSMTRRLSSGTWLSSHWKIYQYVGPPLGRGQQPARPTRAGSRNGRSPRECPPTPK